MFEALKATCGIEITPEDPSFCSGKCYHVLINGGVKGAIVLPIVESYPKNKMELVTSENVKKVLSVETKNVLKIKIL